MIDIEKRSNQAKKYKEHLRAPRWSIEKSADDLKTLAELIRDHKSKSARWEAFVASNLPTDTKSFFNDYLEPAVRKYTTAAKGEPLNGELVRWAIGMGKDVDYGDLDEFDAAIDRYIKEISSSSVKTKDHGKGDDIDLGIAGLIGSIIGYGVVLVPVGAFVLYALGFFDPSPEEIARQEKAEREYEERLLKECKEDLRDSISRSCQSDPVFTYCSLNYESHEILGSGCTGRVKRMGGLSAQIEFCKEKSLSSVFRTCAIEVYGCAAVTGNVNC